MIKAELSQHITMTPFGDGSSLEFDAGLDRVRITDSGGEVHDELTAPRRSMAGYTGEEGCLSQPNHDLYVAARTYAERSGHQYGRTTLSWQKRTRAPGSRFIALPSIVGSPSRSSRTGTSYTESAVRPPGGV
jgi:hypothetical protein